MTNQRIASRLGYLEQGLKQLSDEGKSALAQRIFEQYVANYFDDMGSSSLDIFKDYIYGKSF